MTSRGDRGIPRQEPIRITTTAEAPAPAPPVKTILDELRQWGICKTFVHQFKQMAERIIPKLRPAKKRGKGEGDGHPWQRRHTSFRKKPKPKPKPERQEPPTAVADPEADELRTEELTRPALNVRGSLFSAFRFD
jgi:hypothetical protein